MNQLKLRFSTNCDESII